MTAEPLDLDELERLLVTYHAALSAPVEEGGVRRHRASLAEAVGQLENAAVNALPQLISSARDVEGLREALSRLPDKMRRQVECVRGYDKQSQASDVIGLSAVSISVGHFLDMADEIDAALSPSDAGGGK